jgi:peptide deformylase
MVLPIQQFPKKKILRQKAKEVFFPLSKEVKKLVRDMIDTVKIADGVGLAAPQVGYSVRVVAINLEKNGVPAFVLYNPKIVSKSFKKIPLEEGCLSVPGVFGMVKRPQKITVEALNEQGKKVKFSDEGWIARVIQHEMDHINGRLIIDHISKYTQGKEIVDAWKKEKLL